MKTLSGMLILVFALFFVGCATQEGGNSTNSLQSTSSSSISENHSGGGNEGDTGPDASDSEIVRGSH
jgi:hypothetical protein